METITVNLSVILYYVILYYVVFNINTIIFSDEKVIKFYNTKSILNILNPFRELREIDGGNYILIMLFSLIPYGILLDIICFIKTYNIDFIW